MFWACNTVGPSCAERRSEYDLNNKKCDLFSPYRNPPAYIDDWKTEHYVKNGMPQAQQVPRCYTLETIQSSNGEGKYLAVAGPERNKQYRPLIFYSDVEVQACEEFFEVNLVLQVDALSSEAASSTCAIILCDTSQNSELHIGLFGGPNDKLWHEQYSIKKTKGMNKNEAKGIALDLEKNEDPDNTDSGMDSEYEQIASGRVYDSTKATPLFTNEDTHVRISKAPSTNSNQFLVNVAINGQLAAIGIPFSGENISIDGVGVQLQGKVGLKVRDFAITRLAVVIPQFITLNNSGANLLTPVPFAPMSQRDTLEDVKKVMAKCNFWQRIMEDNADGRSMYTANAINTTSANNSVTQLLLKSITDYKNPATTTIQMLTVGSNEETTLMLGVGVKGKSSMAGVSGFKTCMDENQPTLKRAEDPKTTIGALKMDFSSPDIYHFALMNSPSETCYIPVKDHANFGMGNLRGQPLLVWAAKPDSMLIQVNIHCHNEVGPKKLPSGNCNQAPYCPANRMCVTHFMLNDVKTHDERLTVFFLKKQALLNCLVDGQREALERLYGDSDRKHPLWNGCIFKRYGMLSHRHFGPYKMNMKLSFHPFAKLHLWLVEPAVRGHLRAIDKGVLMVPPHREQKGKGFPNQDGETELMFGFVVNKSRNGLAFSSRIGSTASAITAFKDFTELDFSQNAHKTGMLWARELPSGILEMDREQFVVPDPSAEEYKKVCDHAHAYSLLNSIPAISWTKLDSCAQNQDTITGRVKIRITLAPDFVVGVRNHELEPQKMRSDGDIMLTIQLVGSMPPSRHSRNSMAPNPPEHIPDLHNSVIHEISFYKNKVESKVASVQERKRTILEEFSWAHWDGIISIELGGSEPMTFNEKNNLSAVTMKLQQCIVIAKSLAIAKWEMSATPI